MAELLQEQLGQPRKPVALQRAVARLAGKGFFSAIVTTNYENLLENALDDAGVPYIPQHLERGALVKGRGEVRLIKLHGSREDWLTAVLSGESYREFEQLYRTLTEQIDLLLKQNPILFVGCSLQDPRLLDWLKRQPKKKAGLKPWRSLMTLQEWP